MKWISELLRKRRAKVSCVALIVTRDPPLRLRELAKAVLVSQPDAYRKIIVYDQWEGAREVSLNPDEGKLVFTSISQPSSRGGLASLAGAGQVEPLAGFLRRIDSQVKSMPMLVMLYNIMEQDPTLNLAVKSWATDPLAQVYKAGSLICIFLSLIHI